VREGLSRLSLALVLIAFCLPLFIGLGSTDLANDEAIYSYGVESILTTGDWLSPRSSPNESITFLEKPPLKFWIVAAPIRAGLLPYNEFGLRFWDAVFGAAAFLYVFLLGRRLSGPVCGAVAVLVLFAQGPLLFDHGLRSNNMDAALVLAYCGGIYHYLQWASATAPRSRLRHIIAVAGWFFLGFMTKFVAALFLPAVIGVSALLLTPHRRQLLADRWRWTGAVLGVIVFTVPWFLYQYSRHGRVLWRVMFGEHVYTRFTNFADPGHVHPWHYYLSTGYAELTRSGSVIWVGVGLAILFAETVRRRMPDGFVVLLWFVLPVACISLGSSKLYHYFYPYLPPLALAAGFGVVWLGGLVSRLFEPLLVRWPWLQLDASGKVKAVAVVVVFAALALAVATAINGPLRVRIGDLMLFRNTSIVRPVVVALVGLAVASGMRGAPVGALILVLSLAVPTPLSAYVANLDRLRVPEQRLSSLTRCIQTVYDRRQSAGEQPGGVYAPVSEQGYLHPYFYYLRGRGWHARRADHDALRAALFEPGHERPVVIDKDRYAAFLDTTSREGSLPVAIDMPKIFVLLPGPYAVCNPARQPVR
jgi:4-amino-4-deoxy-L-arabinose transferase-like glycosyltransferase